MTKIESPIPAKKKSAALIVRSLHYYASIFVGIMVLFFAVTGFIATHTHWFEVHGEELTSTRLVEVPATALNEPAQLEQWLGSLLPESVELRPLHDATEQTTENSSLNYLIIGERKTLQCSVQKSERTASIMEMYPLPQVQGGDDLVLAHCIAAELHGQLDSESIYKDDAYHLLSFTVQSVWFEAQVQVFSDLAHYHVATKQTPFIGALINLHKGQHTNTFQTFLTDLTAILLAFVVISGIIMGIQMKKRRRFSYIAVTVSVLLCLCLVLGR